MKKHYEVIVSRSAEQMLKNHILFLARVSINAARRLRKEYAEVLDALEENPYQFPPEEDMDLPDEYRKALFGKRYKAVFSVEASTVYLDAIVDCRQEISGRISR